MKISREMYNRAAEYFDKLPPKNQKDMFIQAAFGNFSYNVVNGEIKGLNVCEDYFIC